VLFDNQTPRYLPHLETPHILHMGLSPLDAQRWIETDADLPRYHAHKLAQRARLGDHCYRALPDSRDAQRELAGLLWAHLTHDQDDLYRGCDDGTLLFQPAALHLPAPDAEPLWECSLWLADDLVIMQEIAGRYHLTAASLCSPSDWLLEEKFARPLAEIHAPIPGFEAELAPRVDRFFQRLRPGRPVVRHNWSLQAGCELCRRPPQNEVTESAARVFYRSERQTLTRLPQSGAVAFTIRVYLHPLERLADTPGALQALFTAIDRTPAAMAVYKGFDRLQPALAKYRVAGRADS